MTVRPEFRPFPKIPRMNRDIIITEKIDGTNAQVVVTLEGDVYAGSRRRWITPDDDNFGFAAWVAEHADELRQLGPGQHFGEWYGRGIQRGYGLENRYFALFNPVRYGFPHTPPACCEVAPVLYQGPFESHEVDAAVEKLRVGGSFLVPGYMRPEGIVVYHTAARTMFKRLIENDDIPKSLAA